MLRPGGAVIVARAGPDHLTELRRRLLGEASVTRREPKQYPAALAENYLRVRTDETLRGDAATSLLEMTPFVRNAPPEQRSSLHAQVAGGTPLRCTVDLIVSTHRVWLGTGGELI